MKRSKKIILISIAVIAAIVCLLCCLYLYQYFRGNWLNNKITGTNGISGTVIQDKLEPTMRIHVDFDALFEMNEEIYAWIEVPGTNINYAVVQSTSDDLFYNTHSVDKSYFSGGSIYSQRYNAKTFRDPVTVLYGHNRQSGTMFAQVNDFADSAVFDANRYIFIYTPDKVYQYEIFAAYPHSSEHLMLCHDFTNEAEFNDYFASLELTAIDSHYRSELLPTFGDKVITLSTCYRQNRMQRYLLQGVLIQEYAVAAR